MFLNFGNVVESLPFFGSLTNPSHGSENSYASIFDRVYDLSEEDDD